MSCCFVVACTSGDNASGTVWTQVQVPSDFMPSRSVPAAQSNGSLPLPVSSCCCPAQRLSARCCCQQLLLPCCRVLAAHECRHPCSWAVTSSQQAPLSAWLRCCWQQHKLEGLLEGLRLASPSYARASAIASNLTQRDRHGKHVLLQYVKEKGR